MIVQLKHADGHRMAFECMAFNVSPDAPIKVSFVSPSGNDLDWDAAAMAVIEEMTIHYDSGVLLQTVKAPIEDGLGGAQGSRHDDMSGRSTAGMGG